MVQNCVGRGSTRWYRTVSIEEALDGTELLSIEEALDGTELLWIEEALDGIELCR